MSDRGRIEARVGGDGEAQLELSTARTPGDGERSMLEPARARASRPATAERRQVEVARALLTAGAVGWAPGERCAA